MQPTILLIEDNYTLRRLYSRTLQRDGMMVLGVETLQDAEQQLSQYQFDAIVCDIELTDGIALDFIGQLRSFGLPIVAMSADENYRVLLDDMGVSAFLLKPIPTRLLAPEVRRVMEQATV